MSMLSALVVPDVHDHDPARLHSLRNIAPAAAIIASDELGAPGVLRRFVGGGISRERDPRPRRGESAANCSARCGWQGWNRSAGLSRSIQ